MPLDFRLSSLVKMASIQGTFLVPFAIVGGALSGAEYFKALFYILGIIILTVVHLFISRIIGHRSSQQFGGRGHMVRSSACDAFSLWGNSDFTAPAWSSSLLTYSFAYLLLPLLINGYQRPVLITLFALFIVIDGIYRWKWLNCYASGSAGLVDVLTGVAYGGTIGAIWYFIVTFINNDFTFFNVPASNRLVCDKPKKKHMRCTAYKNGVKTKSFPVG